ncbi:hypothetical protein ACOMHN_065496 [Nucella lapillus]
MLGIGEGGALCALTGLDQGQVSAQPASCLIYRTCQYPATFLKASILLPSSRSVSCYLPQGQYPATFLKVSILLHSSRSVSCYLPQGQYPATFLKQVSVFKSQQVHEELLWGRTWLRVISAKG